MGTVPAGNRYGQVSRLELVAERRGASTELTHVRTTQPFRVMKAFQGPAPSVDGSASFARVIAMSSSAGLLEGDEQLWHIDVGEGAALSVSAQAYEKIHRMDGPGEARRTVSADVAPSGLLAFLQRPVIPFAGSRFAGSTSIELADETSGLAYGEVIACGRVGRGEMFGFSRFSNRVRVTVSGAPLYAENTVLDPGEQDLGGIGGFEGYTHIATLVIARPGLTEEGFSEVRGLIARRAGEDDAACASSGDAPGRRFAGGITHIGPAGPDGRGASGWAVKLLGRRGQELEDFLREISALAGFPVNRRL